MNFAIEFDTPEPAPRTLAERLSEAFDGATGEETHIPPHVTSEYNSNTKAG